MLVNLTLLESDLSVEPTPISLLNPQAEAKLNVNVFKGRFV